MKLSSVRHVDTAGRITIPSEIRQLLGISVDDNIEIFTSDQSIYLKKYQPIPKTKVRLSKANIKSKIKIRE